MVLEMLNNNALIGILMAILVFFPAYCLGAVYRLYRRYYTHMKAHHKEEWRRLMCKDSAIELIGEWYRWPFGSGYFITSFFKVREYYGDPEVAYMKKKGVILFKLFAVFFVISLATILVLPEL
jgi:hypothetical protein